MIFAHALLAAIPVFTHLSLQDAQTRAVAQDVDVQIARATVRQRDAALEIARSGGVPHLTGNYALAPQAGPFDRNIVEQHMFTVAAGVSINDIVAASAQTRSATNDLLAAQRNAEAATLKAREKAVRLYFGALQSIALQASREDSLRASRRDRDVAAIRVRNGASPRLDVVRADVTVAQAQAELARAKADRENAVEALASATATAVASLDDLSGSQAANPSPPSEEQAVTRALLSRPEVGALLASIQARDSDVATAQMAGWPVATASGGYAAGVDSGQSVHGPAASVTLDIPLAPTTGARVSAAYAQFEVARVQLLDVRRTIALEAASAVREIHAEDESLSAASRAREEAVRAAAGVEIGYREGASSSLDVADARRTATQASIDALVAEYLRAQSYALLEIIAP